MTEQPDLTAQAAAVPGVNDPCSDGERHAWSHHHPAHSPVWIPKCMLCGLVNGQSIAEQVAELIRTASAELLAEVDRLTAERDEAQVGLAEYLAESTRLGEIANDLVQKSKAAKTARARIAEAHSKHVGEGGLTSGDCNECSWHWPCPTYAWATTDRESYACWDPSDDESVPAASEPNRPHVYLSTYCYHGLGGPDGLCGKAQHARGDLTDPHCKNCPAPCICQCHSGGECADRTGGAGQRVHDPSCALDAGHLGWCGPKADREVAL